MNSWTKDILANVLFENNQITVNVKDRAEGWSVRWDNNVIYMECQSRSEILYWGAAIIYSVHAGKDDGLSYTLIIIIYCLLSELLFSSPYAIFDISGKPGHFSTIFMIFFVSVLFPFHQWTNPKTWEELLELQIMKTQIS